MAEHRAVMGQESTSAAVDNDAAGDSSDEEEEEEEDADFEGCNLFDVLRVPKDASVDRVRAAYHKLSLRWHPNEFGWEAAAKQQHARRIFRRVTVAYLVLKDPARRDIYEKHGHSGLVKSENYCEENVFEVDPLAVFEAFWSGENAEDREYLLLHGADQHQSDDDGWEEEDELALPQLPVKPRAQKGHGRGRGNRPPPSPDDGVLQRASVLVGGPATGPRDVPPANPWPRLAAKFPAPVAGAATGAVPTGPPSTAAAPASVAAAAAATSSPAVAVAVATSDDPGAPSPKRRTRPLRVGALRKRRRTTA